MAATGLALETRGAGSRPEARWESEGRVGCPLLLSLNCTCTSFTEVRSVKSCVPVLGKLFSWRADCWPFVSTGGGGWKELLPRVLVTQSCPTLCYPPGPPGSSVHGSLQARILEWVAIPFSRGSSRARDGTRVSCTTGRVLYRATWKVLEAPALLVGRVVGINQRQDLLRGGAQTRWGADFGGVRWGGVGGWQGPQRLTVLHSPCETEVAHAQSAIQFPCRPFPAVSISQLLW